MSRSTPSHTALYCSLFQAEALSLSTSAAQSRSVTPGPGRDSWVRRKTVNNPSDVDYKKLALVNDDLLKVT